MAVTSVPNHVYIPSPNSQFSCLTKAPLAFLMSVLDHSRIYFPLQHLVLLPNSQTQCKKREKNGKYLIQAYNIYLHSWPTQEGLQPGTICLLLCLFCLFPLHTLLLLSGWSCSSLKLLPDCGRPCLSVLFCAPIAQNKTELGESTIFLILSCNASSSKSYSSWVLLF